MPRAARCTGGKAAWASLCHVRPKGGLSTTRGKGVWACVVLEGTREITTRGNGRVSCREGTGGPCAVSAREYGRAWACGRAGALRGA